MSFVYNEESRIHTLNGKVIPSVSNIVAPLSMDYSKVHPGKLANKRDLGVAFHECIRLFLNNDLDEDSIDDYLKPPMQEFKKFWMEYAYEEANVIYDWKLRKYDTVCDPLRMAGYQGLAQHLTADVMIVESVFCNEKLKYCGKPDMITGKPPWKLIVVEFSHEGYRVHDAHKQQAWPMFVKLLEFYKTKQKFDKLCEKWRESI